MNASNTPSCQCVECPGAGCRCGCQHAATPPAAATAVQACACGPRCGCDAAQQGCSCSAPQA
jgi:hypothetical protein